MMLDKQITEEMKKMKKKIAEYKLPDDYLFITRATYYKQQNPDL